jgi:hypothetical protein
MRAIRGASRRFTPPRRVPSVGVGLNPLGTRIRDVLLREHPGWTRYVEILPGGDLEVAVPAPRGSRAGHLVISTTRGESTWVRYSPARMSYPVESVEQLLAVVDALLHDRAFFLVVSNGDEWIETSLLRPGEEPVLAEGQVADVVSWSGLNDRIVTYMPTGPKRGV